MYNNFKLFSFWISSLTVSHGWTVIQPSQGHNYSNYMWLEKPFYDITRCNLWPTAENINWKLVFLEPRLTNQKYKFVIRKKGLRNCVKSNARFWNKRFLILFLLGRNESCTSHNKTLATQTAEIPVSYFHIYTTTKKKRWHSRKNIFWGKTQKAHSSRGSRL